MLFGELKSLTIIGAINGERYIPALKIATDRWNVPPDWLLILELEFGPSPSVSGYSFACLSFVTELVGGDWTSAVAPEDTEACEARSLVSAKYRYFVE